MDDGKRLDLLAFLRSLRGERNPSAVVHGLPLSGKTRYAKLLARTSGVVYVDVLKTAADALAQGARAEELDVPWLRATVSERASDPGSEITLVDDADFLFPMWNGDLAPFREMIRGLAVPPYVAFAFFVQSRDELQTWRFFTAAGRSRVLSFDELKAAPNTAIATLQTHAAHATADQRQGFRRALDG